MFTAIDSSGNKIDAKSAVIGNLYKCPVCGQEVESRICGKIKAPYFAHKKNCKCTDNWHYDMSEWHISWQEKYPICNREVVMTADGKTHRADICIGDYVIEFQHSPISLDDVNERNRFYCSCGKRVIWVFDCIDKMLQEKICFLENESSGVNFVFKWKRASKSLRNIIPQSSTDVVVCMQLLDEENEIEQVIRTDISWEVGNYADYSKFYTSTDTVDIFSEEGISKLFKRIQDKIDLEKRNRENRARMIAEEKAKLELGLYDPLIEYLGTDNSIHVYKCFANNNDELPEDACRLCQYHEYVNDSMCVFRFDHIRSSNVERVFHDKNNYVTKVIFKDGQVELFEKANPPRYTLCEIWNVYGDMDVARVRNVRTNRYFQIKVDPNLQLKRKGKIEGKLSTDGRSYTPKYYEIYYADRPEWEMKWFIKK